MRRLFLHFYVFIFLVLIGLGWSVDQLWQQRQMDTVPAWVHTLGQSLAYQLHQPELPIETIAAKLALDVQRMPIDAIAWSMAEQQALERGQLVPLFHEQQLFYYLRHGTEPLLWQLGPIALEAPARDGHWFTALFFLLLGLAVALWLWPLARDIQKLQTHLHQFGQGMTLPALWLSPHSLLAPIAQSARQMAEQIQRLLHLQREMTHAVSHELRTPLARLSFALEMQKIPESDKAAMQLDLAELDQLVDEMLDYARLESQNVQLHFERVNITELIDSLIEKLAPLPGPTITFRKTESVFCHCDGHYLERALQNLMVNAKRYGQQQIQVSVQRTAEHISMMVEDDGPGIPPEQRDNIIQPFVRLDKSRSKGHGGFGLGLAIVSRIVQWHQGALLIEDSTLGGACFILQLPQNPANRLSEL